MNGIATAIQRWFYYRIGVRDFYRASGSMRQTFKNVVAESLHGPMTSVSIPTLLLWGETDQIVPLWVAKKMKETIAKSLLIAVPNVGHALPYREPTLFVEKSLPFLSSL
jgi:pimeloyl-ACP methyl ester carboxylesterase